MPLRRGVHMIYADAQARIAFAIFVLITSVLVFLFGLSVQDQQPVEGAVIKLLSLIPFLGGAWHIHRAQKALREYARALENDDVAR